ncbi:fibronectin type III domain-containing protein, partial [bacterium]|nr:fibronectin type III domain-containing protein [bacterium]
MKRYFVFLIIILTGIGFGFLGCGGDDGATGPTSGTNLTSPQDVTAEVIDHNSITLSWTYGGVSITGFRIQRTVSGEDNWTQIDSIGTIGSADTSYIDTGLQEATTYEYRMSTYLRNSESAFSDIASVTTVLIAPTNLRAESTSSSDISLSWEENSEVETGVEIHRSVGTNENFALLITLDVDASAFTDSSLTGNTTYHYRVKSVNADNNSNWSDEASATTTTSPQNLVAVPASSSAILLTWEDDSPDDATYTIESVIGDDEGWRNAGRTADNVPTFTVENLVEGTRYRYRVLSFSQNIRSDWSNIAEATTLPIAPNRIEVEEALRGIRVKWIDRSNVEDGFEVERSLDPETGFVQIAYLEENTREYIDEDFEGDLNYYYRVRSIKDGQGSLWTEAISALTSAAPESLTAITEGWNSIRLDWVDVSDNEIGFRVFKSILPDEGFQQLSSIGENVTQYIDNRCLEGIIYYYRVASFTNAAQSAFSDVVSAESFPMFPSELTATRASEFMVWLNWTDNSEVEDGFEIQKSLSAEDGFVTVITTAADAAAYLVEDLEMNTPHFFRIRSVKGLQASNWTEDVTATTTNYKPDAPTNFSAETTGPWDAYCSWTDNANNERGFHIQRSFTGVDDWRDTHSIRDANVVEANIRNLIPNTHYYLRACAYNDSGRSGYTNIVEITTEPGPPNAPSSLQANAPDHHQVDLNWTDNSDNESGFDIERLDPENPNWIPLIRLDDDITRYTDENVEPRLRYDYRVRAFNDIGVSGWSNVALALVPPPAIIAPTDLSASPVSFESISVNWVIHSNNEDGFIIERHEGVEGEFEAVGEVNSRVNRFIDSGLVRGGTYTYRIKAFAIQMDDSRIYSDYSDEASGETYTEIDAPSGLTAVAVGMTVIQLDWVDNSPFRDGIRIERRLEDQGDFEQIHDVDVNSLDDRGLEMETTYQYRIRAYVNYQDEEFISEYSNIATGTTLGEIAFFDDFEDYDAGAAPPNYMLIENGEATAIVSEDSNHEGSQGLELNDPADADWVVIVGQGEEVLFGVASAWMKIAAEGLMEFLGANANDIITFQLVFNADNSFSVRDGANIINGGDEYPVDEWFLVEVAFDVDDQT